MSHKLKIVTLDRFIIELEGEIISKFVSQKAPGLFVYLISHPREHQRDILAELFWSDTSSKQALKNLRTVLSNLQKVGLGDFLDVTRQTLSIINLDDIWLDYQVFEALLDDVEAKQKMPYSPRRLFNEIKIALELYEGDFLVALKTGNALDLDTWVTLERERLRGRAVNAIFQLLGLALENGDYTAGIQFGNRLMSLEPLWEEAVRRVMTLQAYSGNRNAAVQRYDNFTKTLKVELDIPPEDETTALYRAIKTGRMKAKAPQAKANNLQQPSNTYIENVPFVNQIHHYLDKADNRLITILGQGGIGKTRFAQHIAHQRLEDYRDGVFFVPLASVTSPDFVAQAILNALNIPHIDTRRTPKDALLENLREKHLLLILDNMEHLMDSVDLLQSILSFASFIQLIVTSREQLQIQGEQVLAMPVLPYPLDEAKSSDYPALQLFAQVAQLVQPEFELDSVVDEVARICRLVDGLPLAIVIAAGWVQFLPAETIANRIEENIDFLTISRRDLPERHRGITALMNSTWASLGEQERRVMQKLTVFSGDFSLEAAEQIAEASLADLMGLVSKSLLQKGRAERYHQHELLRRYAQERAIGSRIIAQAEKAHTAYFRNWIQELEQSDLPSHERFIAIDSEYHNLWLNEHLSETEQHQQILNLIGIMQDYWIARGFPLGEAVTMLENALSDAEDDLQVTRAMIHLAILYTRTSKLTEAEQMLLDGIRMSCENGNIELEATALNSSIRLNAMQGKFEQAIDYGVQLIEICENTPQEAQYWSQRLLAVAYLNIGTIYSQIKQNTEAEQFALKGLEVTHRTGDMVNMALCHNLLGIVALDHEQYEEAHNHFAEALGIAQDIEHTRFQSIFSANLAESVYKQGDYSFSYQIYIETLQTAHRLNNQKTILNVLEQLAILLGLHLNLPDSASMIFGSAQTLRETLQIVIEPRQQQEFDDLVEGLETAIGQSAFEKAVLDGQNMSIQDAIHHLTMISPDSETTS